jgi:hypothetical protein
MEATSDIVTYLRGKLRQGRGDGCVQGIVTREEGELSGK